MNKPIPETFTHSQDLANAYRMGWNHGHGIACHNVPKLGSEIRTDYLGRVTVTAENIREVHESLCFDAESNSRSYSPFEFIAQEFNSCGEGGWRICDDQGGVSDEVYDTREEAEAAARAEGREDAAVIEVEDADALWEAFESGAADAIFADVKGYTDEDYGIGGEAS